MIRHKSAQKRARQEKKRSIRNISVKSNAKTSVKELLKAVGEKDSTRAREALLAAESTLKKAAAKGVIHKKTAARKVSRLTKKTNTLNSAL